MMNMLNDILLVFIPMFFTVDPIGILPIFASLTQGLTPQEKRDIISHSKLGGCWLYFFRQRDLSFFRHYHG